MATRAINADHIRATGSPRNDPNFKHISDWFQPLDYAPKDYLNNQTPSNFYRTLIGPKLQGVKNDYAGRGFLKNGILGDYLSGRNDTVANMSYGVRESVPGMLGTRTAFKEATVESVQSVIGKSSEALEGLSAFSKFSRAGLAGAGLGLGLSGIGWLGGKMTGGDISSEGPVSSILKGAAIGTTAMGASYGFGKLANLEGSLVKPWMNTVGKIGAGRFGSIGLGIGAAALGAKTILGTSLTRKSN